jgi:hypothetical protein
VRRSVSASFAAAASAAADATQRSKESARSPLSHTLITRIFNAQATQGARARPSPPTRRNESKQARACACRPTQKSRLEEEAETQLCVGGPPSPPRRARSGPRTDAARGAAAVCALLEPRYWLPARPTARGEQAASRDFNGLAPLVVVVAVGTTPPRPLSS